MCSEVDWIKERKGRELDSEAIDEGQPGQLTPIKAPLEGPLALHVGNTEERRESEVRVHACVGASA